MGSNTKEVPLFDMCLRKLDVPIFKGEERENPFGWFNRVERYFVVNRFPEKDKIDAAVLCLEGEALEWHQWEEESRVGKTFGLRKKKIGELNSLS